MCESVSQPVSYPVCQSVNYKWVGGLVGGCVGRWPVGWWIGWLVDGWFAYSCRFIAAFCTFDMSEMLFHTYSL